MSLLCHFTFQTTTAVSGDPTLNGVLLGQANLSPHILTFLDVLHHVITEDQIYAEQKRHIVIWENVSAGLMSMYLTEAGSQPVMWMKCNGQIQLDQEMNVSCTNHLMLVCSYSTTTPV